MAVSDHLIAWIHGRNPDTPAPAADADDFFDDHPGTPGTGYITPTTTIRKSR